MRTSNIQKLIVRWLAFMAIAPFLVAILVGCCNGQSAIKVGTFLTAESASLEKRADGTVEIFTQGLSKETKQVALIVTPYDDGLALVRAYNQKKPFPPKTLVGVNGTFILEDTGTFDIEILAIDSNGRWLAPEYIENVTVDGIKPIPDDPDPIVDAELEELIVRLVAEVNDPVRAKQYANALKKVELAGSLLAMKSQVSEVRRSVFVGPVKEPWYKLFEPMDNKLGELETPEKYKAAIDVLIQVLEEFGTREVSVMKIWTPPPRPWRIGQIFDGKRLIQQCDATGCRLIWVDQ